MNLVYLAQFGDKWRSFVNTVLTFRVPLCAEISYLAEKIISSEQRLCFMELVGWLAS